MKDELRFAVLIDADNISDKYIKTILDETASCGVATYKRIYGDWTNTRLVSWKPLLLDNSIVPIQQYSYTFGKNSTDSAMIIDAMDILYSGNVNGFCIASSDSDFTRLAARLRESGMTVIGMGESKTPKPFIAACNQFKYLDILYSTLEKEEAPQKAPVPQKTQSKPSSNTHSSKHVKPQVAEAPILPSQEKAAKPTLIMETDTTAEKSRPQPQTGLKTIRHAINAIIEESSDDDGWIFTGDIGNQLAKRYPDFDVRNFGYSKLTPFIESLGIYEVKRERASENNNIQLVYVKQK